MREIKFRGMNHETGTFVYGHLTRLPDGATKYLYIISDVDGSLTKYYIQNENTIGQFTGLCDKNGKEIYEGDVVDGYSGKYQLIFVQVTGTGCFFYWKPLEQCTESMTGFIDEYTVIGNIYDNPELLNN